MPFPPRYTAAHDFALDDQLGEAVDGTKLAVELAGVGESVAQIIGFLKAGFTADRRWQPASALSSQLVDTRRHSATAGQTDFAYPNDVTIDTDTDKALVFLNGALVDPSSVTLATTYVTIPATTAGDIVVVALYDDEASVRTDLASTDNAKGASLIGIEDAATILSADNVEDALAEIKALLDTTVAALGNLNNLIRSDGSVAFAADQSMGGNALTNLQDGVDAQDAVTVAQLSALSAVYGDLGALFLALAGGSMTGPIAMNDNKITTLGTPTVNGDATNKSYVDTAIAALGALKLSLAGTVDSVANGTLTGPVSYGALATATADADQTSVPADVVVPTMHGVPQPAANDHIANKKYVDDTVANAAGTKNRLDIVDYETPTGGNITDNGAGSKTWVCPAGVTEITVEAWGGGGGGGAGDGSTTNGSAGGNTTFDASGQLGTDVRVVGVAGAGGQYGDAGRAATGGAGGSLGDADDTYDGTDGETVLDGTAEGGDGGAAMTPYAKVSGGTGGVSGTIYGTGGANPGGGGGGGYSATNGGAGGGAGQFGVLKLTVTPGESYDIQIGAGGAGSDSGGGSVGGTGSTSFLVAGGDGTGNAGGGGGSGRMLIRYTG